MKRILPMALLAAISLVACKKKIVNPLKPDITYDIPYEESVPIKEAFAQAPFLPPPGTTLPAPITMAFPYQAFATDFDKHLQQYNATSNMVKKAEMSSLSIEITAPASQNLDFMDSVRVYAKTKTQPEVLAAYKLPIPNGVNKVNLDVITQDMKQYFLSDSMYVQLVPTLSAIPDSTTVFKISTQFRLTLSGE